MESFKEHRCWEWLYDSDLFGVQNPETGEIGYCSVMGKGGKMYALGVYPDAEGLHSYFEIQRQGEEDPLGLTYNDVDLLRTQKCLMASLEDLSTLEKKDLDSIRKLELKYIGNQGWPLFRKFQPGYLPWFITLEDAKFLTVALQQAVEVTTLFQEKQTLLVPPSGKDDCYLVRMQEAGNWLSVWLPAEDYQAPKPQPVIDEIKIARIQKQGLSQQGTWEVGGIFLDETTPGNPPYFPYVLSIVTSEKSFVLYPELIKPDKLEQGIPRGFFKAIKKGRRLPQTLLVDNEDTYLILQPFTNSLGISLKMVQKLPAVNDFLDGINRYK
ncbi:MAG: hypothetical protein HQM14_10770 [SAR324 cluster bacterium]|nr:hypothetical protein [SAR324 cluster bacterium]